MHKSKIIVLLIIIMFNTKIYALQAKAVKDNQTVFVEISTTEPSRIFVQGDRITKTRGVDGLYDVKSDDTGGEIYIQPNPAFQNKAFNLFITTEQGHHYTLFMKPLGIPAQTIKLKPLSPSAEIAKHWEVNSPYSDVLIKLVRDMRNDDLPEGYAVIDLGKVKPKLLPSGLSMQLLKIYNGNHLEGEVWRLKNDGRNTLTIKPREFYNDDTRSVSLIDENLNCGEETILYRVVSRGN
jgi:conjugal transfer pilus assembly protein TraK